MHLRDYDNDNLKYPLEASPQVVLSPHVFWTACISSQNCTKGSICERVAPYWQLRSATLLHACPDMLVAMTTINNTSSFKSVCAISNIFRNRGKTPFVLRIA